MKCVASETTQLTEESVSNRLQWQLPSHWKKEESRFGSKRKREDSSSENRSEDCLYSEERPRPPPKKAAEVSYPINDTNKAGLGRIMHARSSFQSLYRQEEGLRARLYRRVIGSAATEGAGGRPPSQHHHRGRAGSASFVRWKAKDIQRKYK